MLAIHHSQAGFHPYWIQYCQEKAIPHRVVDCYTSDLIAQVRDCQALLWALSKLDNSNAQGEFYLTDCPEILRKDGRNVDALPVLQPCESLSINTIDELGLVEAKMKEMGYTQR